MEWLNFHHLQYFWMVAREGSVTAASERLRLLGIERILDEEGVGLDMGSLLAFAAVFGMGGSFISLTLSKSTAKRLTGAQVIAEPRNATEAWLVGVLYQIAEGEGVRDEQF